MKKDESNRMEDDVVTKEKLLLEMDAEIENMLEYLKGTMKDLIYQAFDDGQKCAEPEKAEEFAKEIVDHVKDMVDELQKQFNVHPVIIPQPMPPFEPVTTPTWPIPPIITCDASKGNVPEAHFDGGDTDGDNDN